MKVCRCRQQALLSELLVMTVFIPMPFPMLDRKWLS